MPTPKTRFGLPPPNYIPGYGRGATPIKGGVSRDHAKYNRTVDGETDYEKVPEKPELLLAREAKYDKSKESEEEDEMVQTIFDDIDDRRVKKRKKAPESSTKKPETPDEILDSLKLSTSQSLSVNDWLAIPECKMDQSRKKAKYFKNKEKLTSTPESVVQAVMDRDAYVSEVAPIELHRMEGPITEMDEADECFQMALTSIRDLIPVAAQAKTEGLAAAKTFGIEDLEDDTKPVVKPQSLVADISKARAVIQSMMQTDPHSKMTWISAARIEMADRKPQAARAILEKACQENPSCQDLWLENIRFQPTREIKADRVAAALKINALSSADLWLEAMVIESSLLKKRLILQKAMQCLPTAESLWKAALELEVGDLKGAPHCEAQIPGDREAALVLCRKAVDICPSSLNLWLTYVKISPYSEARKILNAAMHALPESDRILIYACQLVELFDNKEEDGSLPRLIEILVSQRPAYGVLDWVNLLIPLEQEGYPLSVDLLLAQAVEEKFDPSCGRQPQVRLIAQGAAVAQAAETWRLNFRLTILAARWAEDPDDLLETLMSLEMTHQTCLKTFREKSQQMLAIAPENANLRLMTAKYLWDHSELEGAREILQQSRQQLDSIPIYLASVKLEYMHDEFDRARTILKECRLKHGGSHQVWLRSIQLDRYNQKYEAALQLTNEALESFPRFPRFHMIKGQLLLEFQGNHKLAATAFQEGIKQCAKTEALALWQLVVPCWVHLHDWRTLRTQIDRARLEYPTAPEIWLLVVQAEEEAYKGSANEKMSILKNLCWTGLQKCPRSGQLWAKSLEFEPRTAYTSQLMTALNACGEDPYVMLEVAKLFSLSDKPEKAKKWFTKINDIHANFGDGWAFHLAYLMESFLKGSVNLADLEGVLQKYEQATPKMGQDWNHLRKKPENWKSSWRVLMKTFISSACVRDYPLINFEQCDLLTLFGA